MIFVLPIYAVGRTTQLPTGVRHAHVWLFDGSIPQGRETFAPLSTYSVSEKEFVPQEIQIFFDKLVSHVGCLHQLVRTEGT